MFNFFFQFLYKKKFNLIEINLRKKQQELEIKLRQLEEQEAQIESKSTGKDRVISGIDSGNDHNYDSIDTSPISSPSTARRTAEEAKRREYQESILRMMAQRAVSGNIPRQAADDLQSCSTNTSELSKIEERKREILKRFGIQYTEPSRCAMLQQYVNDVNSRKPPPHSHFNPTAASSLASSSVPLISDDKNSIDSGFSSVTNIPSHLRQPNKQPINLEVEQLNNEVFNSAKIRQQVKHDFFSFLYTSDQ